MHKHRRCVCLLVYLRPLARSLALPAAGLFTPLRPPSTYIVLSQATYTVHAAGSMPSVIELWPAAIDCKPAVPLSERLSVLKGAPVSLSPPLTAPTRQKVRLWPAAFGRPAGSAFQLSARNCVCLRVRSIIHCRAGTQAASHCLSGDESQMYLAIVFQATNWRGRFWSDRADQYLAFETASARDLLPSNQTCADRRLWNGLEAD